MWVIKWILGAVLVILVIGFAMYNTQEIVTVRFLNWESTMPLWVAMYLSFAAGIVFWLLVSIFQIIALKSENRRCRKNLKRFREELDRLRNISVEESVLPAESTAGKEDNTESVEE